MLIHATVAFAMLFADGGALAVMDSNTTVKGAWQLENNTAMETGGIALNPVWCATHRNGPVKMTG